MKTARPPRLELPEENLNELTVLEVSVRDPRDRSGAAEVVGQFSVTEAGEVYAVDASVVGMVGWVAMYFLRHAAAEVLAGRDRGTVEHPTVSGLLFSWEPELDAHCRRAHEDQEAEGLLR